MPTVLIVEDEYLVRAGLRTCIDWKGHGYTLLEDATNGQDAYEHIRCQRPDILLLDIKMPRMNGFELLERLSGEGLQPYTIILSCCNDFESVRKALQYGVVDYLDKLSLNPEELLRALGKIPETGRHPIEPLTVATSACEQCPEDIFTRLLAGEQCSPRELECLFPKGYVAYLYFSSASQARLPSANLLQNMITQQLLSWGVSCLACGEAKRGIALLLSEDKRIERVMQRLCEHLNGILDVSCACGLSGRYESPQEIYQQLAFAKQIENCLYWEQPRLFSVFQGVLAPSHVEQERFAMLREQAHNSLLAHTRDGALAAISAFTEEFILPQSLPPEAYTRFALSMAEVFRCDGLKHAYISCQQEIIKAHTAAEVNQALFSYVRQSLDSTYLFHSGHYSPIVEKVIQYILENPQRIIQLSEAAQHANVSDSYLSQLFKKETGENYISFVHRYKVNLAKEMLEQHMLIYEICDKIGFENANYFSKIFRRYTGYTPSNYKKSLP